MIHSCLVCVCIAAASAAAASGGGDAGAGVCWCCCCSCRAMNPPPRQETNSQTFFPKPTRNSKTLIKKYKFPALGSSWQLVHIAFLLPCSCCKLLGCYFGCCCCAASAAAAATVCHTSCHAAAAGSCWASCSCCCCSHAVPAAVLQLHLVLLLLVVVPVLASVDAAAAPAVPWTSLQGKKPTARHFFRNPLETAKHHLYFVPKMTRNHCARTSSPEAGTSLLKSY